jgi:ADP-ribose pyrophosphatase YjhB (NUDIX family)
MQFNKLKKVTSAFIYSKNKLLLHLRDEKKGIVYPGCWGLIGGALNKDEDPYDGIKREIKEEISITNLKKLNFVDTFLNIKGENVMHYVFRACLFKSSKIILNEGIEYSFFTKSDFLRRYKISEKLKKKCFIANHPVMKKFYLKTLKN